MIRALGLCPSGLVGLLSLLLQAVPFPECCTSVTMQNWAAGAQLLDLRHTLAFQRAELLDIGFHAAEDKQYVRDQVYQLVRSVPLDIDAVILDKRKTYPHIAVNEGHFYQLA